jgi:cystinosin
MLSFLADISGWIYFVSWTFLFYPQIYLNYKKKSVAGLSYDFVSYTILGSTAYFLFNMILFFSTKASKEYMNIFELSKSPIQLNDFVFATNSLLSCLIFVYQCMIYDVIFENSIQRVVLKIFQTQPLLLFLLVTLLLDFIF